MSLLLPCLSTHRSCSSLFLRCPPSPIPSIRHGQVAQGRAEGTCNLIILSHGQHELSHHTTPGGGWVGGREWICNGGNDIHRPQLLAFRPNTSTPGVASSPCRNGGPPSGDPLRRRGNWNTSAGESRWWKPPLRVWLGLGHGMDVGREQ